MSDTPSSREEVGSAYEKHQKILTTVVAKFRRCHGGDPQELLSEANMVFLRCHGGFDPTKASFTTYLSRSVWRGLVDYTRRLRGRGKSQKARPVGDCGGELIPDRQHFDLSRFKLELSEDAQKVVDYTLSPPLNVKAALRLGNFRGCSFLREFGHSNCLTPEARFAYALGDFLAEMGWSRERVLRSFRELQDAVTN